MSKTTGAASGPSRSASTRRGVDPFFWLSVAAGTMIMAYILLPLGQMLFAPTLESMAQAASDADVRNAIGLSLAAAGIVALVSLLFGTPLAYLLARREFPGRKIVESLIDLPIMIPHPVVGIAILGLTGRNHWLGRALQELGDGFACRGRAGLQSRGVPPGGRGSRRRGAGRALRELLSGDDLFARARRFSGFPGSARRGFGIVLLRDQAALPGVRVPSRFAGLAGAARSRVARLLALPAVWDRG
jgi:fumarate reductase subunit D